MICCYEMRKGRGSCVEPSSLKNFGSMFDAEAIHAQIPSNIEPNYHHHDPLTSLRLCVLTCHCERRVSSQARGVQTEFTGFRRRRLGGAGDGHTASRGFLTFAPFTINYHQVVIDLKVRRKMSVDRSCVEPSGQKNLC